MENKPARLPLEKVLSGIPLSWVDRRPATSKLACYSALIAFER